MSVAEAARTYEETKREMDRLKGQLESSSEVLKEYFRKNGKRDYKGRIGYAVLSRSQLDTAKVKAELGDRLEDFLRRISYEQLSLLK